jgi:large subunit ribosomal protein LP0
MVKTDRSTWKQNYFIKLLRLLDEYPKLLIVGVDNVGSSQMQQIRIGLRHKAEILLGKNTMIRKAIRGHLEENPKLEALLPHIKYNVGFVFTTHDLSDVRDALLANKVAAPAKAGAIAPIDVFIPPGPTTLGPEKTSFFQALSIPTKITKGTIEILNQVHLIKINEKVGASEATLLNMLEIHPFSYGLELKMVYEAGQTYEPSILNIRTSDVLARFHEGVKNVAAISLAINYPTVVSAPHSILNGFKNVLSIALATEITFKQAEKAKAYLANPGAFAVAAAPVKEEKAAAKEEPKKEEKKEESDGGDMGFGLFD